MTTKFMVLKSGHNVIYNNALKYFNFFLFGGNLYTLLIIRNQIIPTQK